MLLRSNPAAGLRVLAAVAIVASLAAAQVTPYSGNVGGATGPFDVLLINGSAGGADHAVDVGLNQSVTVSVVPNGTVGAGAPFALFGFVGQPGPADASVLPLGLGTSAFPFAVLAPPAIQLFTFADNIGLGVPAFVPSTPAPWSLPFAPGFPVAFTVTLQGAILDPAGVLGLSITNAVVLNVVDQRVEVIYTKIPGHPTAVVPGAMDPSGVPAVTEFKAFEQLVGSPDGSRWMIRGRTAQGTASETMMMIGGGTTGNVFAQKGLPVHGGAAGEVYDFFGSGLGRFNDNNDFAYTARAAGGPTGTLQKCIRVVGGIPSMVLREGTPITGLVDVAANPVGDELFGNSVGSAHLLNDGRVGTQDSTITNIHSTRRPAIFYDTAAFKQANVSSVFGLGGLTTETWASFTANRFYSTPDGTRWVAAGTIVAPTASDAVLAVDGTVVIQEGVAIPGSSLVASSILNFDLSSNGHWFVRGAAASGVYAVVDGTLVAKSGDPIVPGSAETWGTTFSAFVGNRNGDWALFGSVVGATAANDDVVVINGTNVVLREGDPVDLNGNGLFDDDAFIGRGTNTLTAFSADNAFLTPNRTLYLFVNLRNGAGQDLNNVPAFGTPLALIRLRVAAN